MNDMETLEVSDNLKEKVEGMKARLGQLKAEIAKAIVGHHEIVEGVLICLLCNGHALLEGVPGLGKTSLIKSLGEAMDLKASRIQFTPDLMPADIIGTNIVMQDESNRKFFQFQPGPIFANIILADEINRATPKTQSALLEAMQEQSVTVGGVRHGIDLPFIVLATQNPIEMEGTYPLPEAQLDRFFFKLNVDYPSPQEISEIVDKTTRNEKPELHRVLDSSTVNEMKGFVREIPIATHVKDYAIRIVLATRPGSEPATEMTERYIRYGASPRGVQSLVLAGKVKALFDGRFNVSFEDIRQVSKPSLRHRLILNFEGEAGGISPENIIEDIIQKTPETV
jgi:MoxR-like ATPase